MKIEKKNPKKMRLAMSITSLKALPRNSFGTNFRFTMIVSTAESAIVKLAILALMARMIRGTDMFT